MKLFFHNGGMGGGGQKHGMVFVCVCVFRSGPWYYFCVDETNMRPWGRVMCNDATTWVDV